MGSNFKDEECTSIFQKFDYKQMLDCIDSKEDGSNMPNINQKITKSIYTQKKIVKLVEPLAL